ncbi:MAG: precorrin-8X methylmutase [Anaerolineales bacterium]|nr:precorrin-8X methylmutase [Anaerolineales bacterium]
MIDHVQNPALIAADSFAIIRAELQAAGYHFAPPLAAVVERIIHSTADFDFASNTQTSPGAIEAGVQALRRGCPVVTDVNMVRIGISAPRLVALGGTVHCFVAADLTRERAQTAEITRSALGMRLAAEQGLLEGGLAVIGNAPTALYEVLHWVKEGVRPALVIGVPVGFVSTVESKEALMRVSTAPWIVTAGRKGGSTVAVAIVNALLRLAGDAAATEID